jgi:hypothetical protein
MKKNITSNQGLVVVKAKAISPPPVIPKMSKSDIIGAMVERARQKHYADSEAYDSKMAALIIRMNDEASKALKETIDTVSIEVEPPYRYNDEGDAPKDIAINIRVTSIAMRALLKEWSTLKKTDPVYFSEDTTKEKIKKSMDNTEDKINLILAQPENVETIDGLLKKIFIKKGE